MKRLYRSKSERSVAGVCGGIAQFFNIDPTLVRILWVIISVFSASVPGLFIYIICALIIPEEPDGVDSTAYYTEDNSSNTNSNDTDFYYNNRQ